MTHPFKDNRSMKTDMKKNLAAVLLVMSLGGFGHTPKPRCHCGFYFWGRWPSSTRGPVQTTRAGAG